MDRNRTSNVLRHAIFIALRLCTVVSLWQAPIPWIHCHGTQLGIGISDASATLMNNHLAVCHADEAFKSDHDLGWHLHWILPNWAHALDDTPDDELPSQEAMAFDQATLSTTDSFLIRAPITVDSGSCYPEMSLPLRAVTTAKTRLVSRVVWRDSTSVSSLLTCGQKFAVVCRVFTWQDCPLICRSTRCRHLCTWAGPMSNALLRRAPIMNRPRGIQIAVATIVVTSIAGVLFASLLVRPKIEKDSAAGDADAVRDHVELSDEKFQAAEIKVAPAAKRELRRHRTLPGRLEYNATRHVELKAPFDGFIRRIDVKVGDRVTVGQVLAIVDSPELGDKRADVLLRETDLQQAKNEHDWWHEIQANLDELVARLKRPQEMPSGEKDEVSQFEKDFADKPLGDYRQQILAAYSRMRLDEKLSANAKAAAASGAVAGQRKLELDAARDTSRAKFAAACEQATFDVKQMHIKAESAMDDAGRRLEVARQRLGSLVGQSSETLPSVESKSALSTWPVKAPFTATIEEVLLPPNERLRMGQGLFQLADTSQLWVQADIRERDWSALSIEAGQTILMQTPALPGKTLEATVAFVGRSVTPESRAVPLIADVDNKSGLLRPGMFLRVLIPDKQTHECLTVPQSSIAENDGRAFVFVQTGPREFHPRDVKTGMSVDPWIEIVSGLNEGEQVVTEGTVLLKAELLLQAED